MSDRLLNLSWDHFGLHQGQYVKVSLLWPTLVGEVITLRWVWPLILWLPWYLNLSMENLKWSINWLIKLMYARVMSGLRGFYTMNHEDVPRPCKISDRLLNSSWDHFGLHQGQYVRVTMEFKVPKIHILRPTLSFDMVQRVLRWERQRRCSSSKRQGPMVNKFCYNKVLMNLFFGGRKYEDKVKTRWRQEKTKEWSNFKFSKFPFLNVIHFWVHGRSLGSIWFTPSEGIKGFVNLLFF